MVETSLVVEPHQDTDGPRLEIPIRVSSSLPRSLAKAVAVTAALSLLALPTILSGWSDLARVGLALAGAFAASMLQVFGLPLPKSVSLPRLGRERFGGTATPQ